MKTGLGDVVDEWLSRGLALGTQFSCGGSRFVCFFQSRFLISKKCLTSRLQRCLLVFVSLTARGYMFRITNLDIIGYQIWHLTNSTNNPTLILCAPGGVQNLKEADWYMDFDWRNLVA